MKTFVQLLLLISLPLLTVAQVQISSLEEAFQYAEKSNRDLGISDLRLSSENENTRIIHSAFLPQIKAVSNLDYNYALPVQLIPAQFLGGKEGDYRKIQFGTKYNYSAGLEASMPLINTSLWEDLLITRTNLQASEAGRENQKTEVMKQIARGYYLCLLSKKSLELSRTNLSIADSLRLTADKKLQHGLIDQLEYNRAETNFLQLKNEVIQNEAVLRNNLNLLRYNLGMKQNEELSVNAAELTETLPGSISPADRKNYPSVREKEAMLRSAMYAVRKEQLKRLPELSLYGRYLRQAQRNEFNFLESNQPWFDIGVAGIRFEMPIFTGLTRMSNIQKSKIKVKIQKAELEKETERVATEDAEIISNYNASLQTAENLRNSYRLSDDNLKIGLLKYREGVYSIDQYFNLETQSYITQSQYLKALTEAYINKSIIDLKNRNQ